MAKDSLKRLSRRELFEIIYTMKKNELALQEQLQAAEKKLEVRQASIQNVGSIAEAALVLNGVFEAAQAAADSYVLSVGDANSEVHSMISDAQAECDALLEAAKREAEACIRAAEQERDAILADVQNQVDARWETFQRNVREYLQLHTEIMEMLYIK